MSEASEFRYVRSADSTSIAYHVSGEGSIDLVYVGGQAIDLWDDPGFRRLARRLGSFARIIWMHGRGWGGSEGDPKDMYVGEITDADMSAVLEAEALDPLCHRAIIPS